MSAPGGTGDCRVVRTDNTRGCENLRNAKVTDIERLARIWHER